MYIDGCHSLRSPGTQARRIAQLHNLLLSGFSPRIRFCKSTTLFVSSSVGAPDCTATVQHCSKQSNKPQSVGLTGSRRQTSFAVQVGVPIRMWHHVKTMKPWLVAFWLNKHYIRIPHLNVADCSVNLLPSCAPPNEHFLCDTNKKDLEDLASRVSLTTSMCMSFCVLTRTLFLLLNNDSEPSKSLFCIPSFHITCLFPLSFFSPPSSPQPHNTAGHLIVFHMHLSFAGIS